MHTLTTMEVWGLMGLVVVTVVATYLTGVWRAEVKLREAFNTRREIRALPGWQPVMMELHVAGYTYLEIAGKLQLEPKYVLSELSKAYSTLAHKPARARASYPNRYRARSRIMHQLARVIS